MASVMRPRPRILHLLSDWKWTGPAEPIVNLCRNLRRQGQMVDLACQKPPHSYPKSIPHHANQRRVDVILDFKLNKRFNFFDNFHDIRALAEFIDREDVNIIHVHSSHDHYIGSRAAKRSNNQPFIVRSNHRGAPLASTFANRRLIKGHTAAWVALSPSCLEQDVRNFAIDPQHGVAVEGTVDLNRFNSDRKYSDIRPELGLGPEHIIAGTVARVQKHRRFDVLLGALDAAMRQEPNLRAMIIGRGTNFDELVRDPVMHLGLGEKVILPGYLTDEYADYLAAIDFKIFLVPGSDGSCRAAREAMAIGRPVLAARRGLLPELVEDGTCGLVIDDTPEGLRNAILRMARDGEMRKAMGRAAAEKARRRFGIEQQVEAIGDLYMRLMEGR